MKKYKTLKEVVAAIKSGELDESNLRVVMDNDHTGIYDKSRCICTDEDKKDKEHWCDCDEKIFTGNGYYDIEPLYELLFPKADVQWC